MLIVEKFQKTHTVYSFSFSHYLCNLNSLVSLCHAKVKRMGGQLDSS